MKLLAGTSTRPRELVNEIGSLSLLKGGTMTGRFGRFRPNRRMRLLIIEDNRGIAANLTDYLRFAAEGSEIAGAPKRIVCCAHASVFDPAQGAKPFSGPATLPILPVRLVYGPGGCRQPIEGKTITLPLSQYSKAVPAC